jgi:hypothetical protein
VVASVLKSIFSDIETANRGFAFHQIATRFESALKDLGDGPHPDREHLRAECIAFSFSEGGGVTAGWNTYYGPAFSATLEDGSERHFPPLSIVDAAMVDYWMGRADVASNAALRARYADLVWDLSKACVQRRADVRFAQIAIDSSLASVRGMTFRYPADAIGRLRRALDVSVSIRDAARTKGAADEFLALEARIAKDHLPGLWGFSFDALVLETKDALEKREREKLVIEMEERLARLANKSNPNPTHVEAAASRLLTFYRTSKQREDELRILRKHAESIERFAVNAPPSIGTSWLDRVHKMYVDNGLQAEADRVALKMREVERKSLNELRPYSTTITVSQEEIDVQVSSLLSGSTDEAMARFASAFVIRADEIEGGLQGLTKSNPFLAMIGVSIRDHEGRETASVGSVADDLEGRIAFEMSQRLTMSAPFLRHVCRELWQRHSLTTEKVVNFLGSDSMFSRERFGFVARGVEAYGTGDDHVALCILLPEIESALRRALELLEGSVYKRRPRGGGTNLRNLDEILRDEVIVSALSKEIAFYLRVLLTDARGWNLRNEVCHGLLHPKQVGRARSDRVFHSLILLGCFRATANDSAEPGDGGGQGA